MKALPATSNRYLPSWERTLLDVEVTTGDNGFFQLAGLRPGVYRVEIGAPGRVSEVLEPVEVEAASETVLGTVSVSPPLKLSVQVFPPVAPDGRPWTLMLAPLRPLPGEDLHRAAVGEDGTADLTSIRPTEYVVRVMDEAGAALLVEEHEIRGDEWLTLEVPVVGVEGVIRQGGEPVAARLRLETGQGDQAEFESDEGGIFRGWMRRPTRPWLMATVTWTEGSERRSRVVEVVPEMEPGSLFLEIDLPAGSILGQVVDEGGRPRPGVRVLAVPAERYSQWTQVQGQTDRNGRFRLTGLDETLHLVRAGGRGGPASAVEEVDLGGLFPIGEVQLVLRPTRPVTGRVTHGGQPVAGASVLVDGLGAAPVSVRSETDPEGRFQLSVPESMGRAVVTVVAPSHGLWSGCVAIGDEGLPLALPDLPTGTLQVTTTSETDVTPRLGGEVVVVTGDGGFLRFATLIGWSRSRNGRFEMDRGDDESSWIVGAPGVAAGSYAITWSGEPPWVLGARTCTGTVQDLEWQTLPPGGALDLLYEAEPDGEERSADG